MSTSFLGRRTKTRRARKLSVKSSSVFTAAACCYCCLLGVLTVSASSSSLQGGVGAQRLPPPPPPPPEHSIGRTVSANQSVVPPMQRNGTPPPPPPEEKQKQTTKLLQQLPLPPPQPQVLSSLIDARRPPPPANEEETRTEEVELGSFAEVDTSKDKDDSTRADKELESAELSQESEKESVHLVTEEAMKLNTSLADAQQRIHPPPPKPVQEVQKETNDAPKEETKQGASELSQPPIKDFHNHQTKIAPPPPPPAETTKSKEEEEKQADARSEDGAQKDSESRQTSSVADSQTMTDAKPGQSVRTPPSLQQQEQQQQFSQLPPPHETYQKPPPGPGMASTQWHAGQPPPPQQQRQQQQQQRFAQQPPPYYQQRQPLQQQQQHAPARRQDPQGFQPARQKQQPWRPPPQQRPLPDRQRQQAPRALRMLWRRVERGLDELADLEEAVSGRAKQLLSVSTSRIPIPNLPIPGISSKDDESEEEKTKWAPDTKTQQPKLGPLTKRPGEKRTGEATPKPVFGVSAPFVKVEEEEEEELDAEESDRRVSSGAEKFELYKIYATDSKKTESTNEKHEVGSAGAPDRRTQSPLEDILMGRGKMIRANGGASHPDRETVPSQQRAAPSAEKKVEWREEMTNPFAPGYTGERAETRPFRPPQQSTLEGPSRPHETKPRPNPFAEQRIQHSGSIHQSRSADYDPNVPKYDDDDEDSRSPWGRFVSVLPPLPHLPSISKLMGRGSGGSYKSYAAASLDAWRREDEESESKGFMGIFGRKQPSTVTPSLARPPTSAQSKMSREGTTSRTPPIDELLSRSDSGKTSSLLSLSDKRNARSIGHSRAALDVLSLGFLLVAAREMLPHQLNVAWHYRIAEFTGKTIPKLASMLSASKKGWAYYALFAAFLCSRTDMVLNDYKIRSTLGNLGSSVERATEYGQLYLRLLSSIPIDRHLPDRVSSAATSQFVAAVESARLRSFVTLVLSVILLITVSAVKPVLEGLFDALSHIILLDQWRHWPLAWAEVGGELKTTLIHLGETLRELIAGELGTVMDHPLNLAFKASLFGVLMAVAVLPMIEQKRYKSLPATEVDDDEDSGVHAGNANSLANLGISSTSRLALLSNSGSLETNLERWRSILPENDESESMWTIRSTLTLAGYRLLATALLGLPLLIISLTEMSFNAVESKAIIRLDSLMDVSILVALTLTLAWNALSRVMESSVAQSAVVPFLQLLSKTVEDFNRSQDSQLMNLQLSASISPTKGLEVQDLWAAHTAKRAWAVRGASLVCRNGEVLVILGDDGSGKTRLLTAISEVLLQPPSVSLSTTKVRGTVSLCGLEATKWDGKSLKKRVGIVLNDVRTVTDTAELLSGLTLEEILEPLDGMHDPNQSHTLGKHGRNCMLMALQITGLSNLLIPKLPSKLATVVTANEDELKPSPLRPRCNPLSPAEWSKLLFARVLAQAILDNDSAAKSHDGSLDKCLVGSTLLLDDVLAHMSEVEEAKVMMALRRTGAATVLTSHRWATGRYADRIAVVKGGMIVEQGTHNGLLARGPQESIYASKWHAMTSF